MSDITTLMMGAAGQVGGDYQISRSLRFNSADSAYLTRTPASAGNRKTWTWSGWVKKSGLASYQSIFTAIQDSSNATSLLFWNDDTLYYRTEIAGAENNLKTTQVFRDPSSWYHIVLVVDTTQATASDRTSIYVNGVEITDFSLTGYQSQNGDTFVNSTFAHRVGSSNGSNYFNGYLADINFIDGQALTPSSFGEVDAVTGVWKPIAYAGTYGTNGFHLDFSDNSSTTALGYDAAGSNDWTPNNFSVTAGAGNDSLVDTPTQSGVDTGAGGEVTGNYCTANPLDTHSTIALANGNLQYSTSVTSWKQSRATLSVPTTDKWYIEYTITATLNPNHTMLGFCTQAASLATYTGASANSVSWQGGGDVWANNTNTPTGFTFAQGDVVMISIDRANQKIWLGKNGAWLNSGNPVAGTGNITQFSSNIPTTGDYFPALSINASGTTINANFGQRPFAYTAPSGFKALCTTNLPDPTVLQGDDHFNTVLYTGTGSARSVTGVGFQPDWVWIKSRSYAGAHNVVFDAVRGANNRLSTNLDIAEDTGGGFGVVSAFNSDGFSLDGGGQNVNNNTSTYAAWNWKANGAGSSNTDGSITSTVSANTTAGISIVTYTGNGTAGATVGHGLGVTPDMLIFKNRDNTDGWIVFHRYVGGSDDWWDSRLLLASTAARADNAGYLTAAPTSTLLTLSNTTPVNTNTEKYILYCFASISGFSAFGSYTGNGSTDGPFVYTGFRPAFVMVKRTDNVGDWWMFDAARNTYNVLDDYLYANQSAAEASDNTLDFVSNGFKLRIATYQPNTSGAAYIYMAFAENPFKNSLAR